MLLSTTRGTPFANQLQSLCEGLLQDYVACLTCSSRRDRPDPFLNLPLQVQGYGTVEEAIAAFVQPETLEGSNAYACSVCGCKQPARKGTSLVRCPPLLTLQLKRFDMDWARMQRIKLLCPIQFPQQLDLRPYCTGTEPNHDNQQTHPVYSLYSVLIHRGHAGGGHYYSYTYDDVTQAWYECNDASVVPLTPEEVQCMFTMKPMPNKATATTTATAAATDHGHANITDDVPMAPIPDAPTAPPAPPMDVPMTAIPDAPPAPPPLPPVLSARVVPSRATGPASVSRGGASFLDELENTSRRAVVERPCHISASASTSTSPSVNRALLNHPAVNAYMLMYRADHLKGQPPPPCSSLLPESVLAEIAAENALFDEERRDMKQTQATATFIVHWAGKDKDKGKDKEPEQQIPVSVPKSSPLLAVVSWLSAHLSIPACNLRLRDYDVHRTRPLQPLELTRYIPSFGWGSHKHLYLERNMGDGFLEYVPPSFHIPVVRWDPTTRTMHPPITVDITEDATMEQLRAKLAATFHTSPQQVDIIQWHDHSSDLHIAELRASTDHALVKHVWYPAIHLGDSLLKQMEPPKPTVLQDDPVTTPVVIDPSLYVEILLNPSPSPASTSTSTSTCTPTPTPTLSAHFHSIAHTVRVTFNRLDSMDVTAHSVDVDERHDLRALKQRMAQVLGVAEEQFKIRREHNGPELKDVSRVLSLYHVRELGSLYVERGAPMTRGQFIVQIYRHVTDWEARCCCCCCCQQQQQQQQQQSQPPQQHNHDDSSAPTRTCTPVPAPALSSNPVDSGDADDASFLYMGSIIMHEEWTFQQVTEAIATLPGAPNPNCMRLRARLGGVVSGVHLPHLLLRENIRGLEDGSIIVLQVLDEPEHLTTNDLVVYLTQWRQDRATLQTPKEVALSRSMTLALLREYCANLINSAGLATTHVTCSDIRLVHVSRAQLQDTNIIPFLAWDDNAKYHDTQTLQGLRCRHGDTILYQVAPNIKFLQVGPTQLDVAARARLFNLQHAQHNLRLSAGLGVVGHSSSSAARGGPPLKIYSAADVAERAAKREEQQQRVNTLITQQQQAAKEAYQT